MSNPYLQPGCSQSMIDRYLDGDDYRDECDEDPTPDDLELYTHILPASEDPICPF